MANDPILTLSKIIFKIHKVFYSVPDLSYFCLIFERYYDNSQGVAKKLAWRRLSIVLGKARKNMV